MNVLQASGTSGARSDVRSNAIPSDPRERTAARLGQVSRHTAAVLLANFFTLVLGLCVTVAAARLFGTGSQVDAFFVAFSIPQVASQILLSVALLVIVPAYARRRNQEGVEGALRWMAPLFCGATLALSLLAGVLVLCAPWLVGMAAPGFSPDAAALAVRMLAWLSPSIVPLGLSGMLQGIANTHGHFFKSAWARLLPQALGLFALLLYHEEFGFDAFAWGMTAGALLGLAWQWQEVAQLGPFGFRVRGFWSSLKDVRGALGPIVASRAITVGGGLVSATVASTVAVGAVAVLGFAFRIASIPFLLSASFGLVMFPALALARVEDQPWAESRLLDDSVRLMGLFGLASAIPLLILAAPLVSVLFERGEFGSRDTLQTARVLQIFALAIPPAVVNTQIGNAYWARGLRVSRMAIEFAGVAVLLVSSFVLGRRFGVSGLAAAVAFQYAAQVALAVWPVPQLWKYSPSTKAMWSLRTPLALAAVECIALYGFAPAPASFFAWPWMAKAMLVGALMAGSMGLFLLLCFVWAVPEADRLCVMLFKRLPRYSVLAEAEQELLANRIRSRLGRAVRGLWPMRSRTSTRAADLPVFLAKPADAAGVVRSFRETPLAFGCYLGQMPVRHSAEASLCTAKALCREVDLLGSGSVLLGHPIQWNRDYVSGYLWSHKPSEQLQLVDLKSDADCKFPWELARCQHWLHLASGLDRPRCKGELLDQFSEFVGANPPGVGITYGNAMEVAIRSVNWILAFRALGTDVDAESVEHLAVEMAQAGRFIRSHLEQVRPGLNTNHYIADLLGLYVISTYFPSFAESPEWYRWAGDELGRELRHQFDEQGMHREGSPSYARLVLEFYLAAFLLGKSCQDPRVDDWAFVLERALGALSDLLCEGALPRLGDDDSGRLLVPPGEPTEDFRYLVQIGAVLWQRSDWKARAGVARPGLEFWLGMDAVLQYETLPGAEAESGTHVFEEAGLAVHRTADTFLALQGGRRGSSPRAHLHNDLTSFVYWADREWWILDPGTYQYSRQATWRNRFRSTAVHNVVQLNGREQNPFRPEWLFYMGKGAEPLPVQVQDGTLYSGYEWKMGQTCHQVERRILPSVDGRWLDVHDSLDGFGEGEAILGLNVALRPFSYVRRDLIVFRSEKGALLVHLPATCGLNLSVTDSWYSPRFGVRERCFRLEAKGNVELPWQGSWRLAACPCEEPVEPWVERLLAEPQPESVLVRS